MRVKRFVGVLALVLATGCGSTVQVTGSSSPGGLGDGLGGPATEPTTTAGASSGPGATVDLGGTGAVPGAAVGPAQPGQSAGQGASARPGAPVAVTPGKVADSGRGWTRSAVSIGVMTQRDVQAVAESFSLSSVDAGDQEGDVRAVLQHINVNGGLFGRQVKAQFYDIASASDGDTQGQAACEHFTRDVAVVAVYAMALVGDTPGFRTCMAKAKVPVFAGGGQAFDEQVFRSLNGYYTLMTFPSYDRFVPSFVDRLVAQDYFSPWDFTRGAPGTVKSKVGFLCPDTPIGRRVGGIVSRELKRVGHAAAKEVYYATSNADVTGYVVQMRSEGVSHVLFCDLGLFVFATQAETQRYRPRYGVSSFNTPALFLQGTVPDAQLAGAVGSGFLPTMDVDAAHDPSRAEMPAVARCEAIGKKGGVSYAPDKRLAHGILYETCDTLQLLVASAKTAVALDGPGLVRGLAAVGPTWSPAIAWRSGLSATVHGLPAGARDLAFVAGCRCFQYRGGTRAFP